MKDAEWNDFGGAPSKHYERFFKKLAEVNIIPTVDWKLHHIVGYFAKKYHELYNTQYKLKCNSTAPGKCMEVVKARVIQYRLSADPEILKAYIDWVFEEKIIKQKRRITSISFLTTENFIEEYKFNILLAGNQEVKRSTALPSNVIDILAEAGKSILTYGELSFLHQMIESDLNTKLIFNEISSIGFDVSILEKVV